MASLLRFWCVIDVFQNRNQANWSDGIKSFWHAWNFIFDVSLIKSISLQIMLLTKERRSAREEVV